MSDQPKLTPLRLTPPDLSNLRVTPPDFSGLRLDPPDFSAFRSVRAALEQMGRTLAEAFTQIVPVLRNIGRTAEVIRDVVNSEQSVAGYCARYQVRAALDPAYVTPEALSGLICGLLRCPRGEDPVLVLLTPENRIRVAVAALYGYARHRPYTADAPLTFGGTVEHHLVRRHTFTGRVTQ